MPHPHYSESPDAELIALAERIIADAAARESIVTDDDYNEATGQLLDLVDKLITMTPRTSAGLRAKARAALAIAARNADGSIATDHPKSAAFAWQVVADAANLPGW